MILCRRQNRTQDIKDHSLGIRVKLFDQPEGAFVRVNVTHEPLAIGQFEMIFLYQEGENFAPLITRVRRKKSFCVFVVKILFFCKYSEFLL